MLRIKNLTKAYGDKKAVDDLSLNIQRGEIYGFIGHNGAGKTTTLKSVVGILDFDEGEIYIDGKSIRKSPVECKRLIAYIPDNPDLYDFMSGIKYLNFVADIFGVSSDERQEKIRKYADAFELTQDLAQPISSYSHGMKQKLAVISAWLHSPKLIVMDDRDHSAQAERRCHNSSVRRLGLCRLICRTVFFDRTADRSCPLSDCLDSHIYIRVYAVVPLA